MQVKMVNIDALKAHPMNPRVHPESAIDKLECSIKEFGWTNPILVSADGYILAGHARLKAAKQAGLKEVPVIHLPLEGAKAEAYMIADNRLQDETDWDYEVLKDLIDQIDAQGVDVLLTGFDEYELEGMQFEDIGLKDEIEEKDNPPTMRIIFEREQDFRSMEEDLRKLIDEKYERVKVAILCGEV